jgi:sterol desaturase/sphingolipid hydroxylase (fatty acid hydroxylase superfamily)
MTYSIRHVLGITSRDTRKGFFGTKQPLFGADWAASRLGCGNWSLADVWTYAIGCHLGHLLEFGVALLAYWLFFADGTWERECATLRPGWTARVLAFHLACELMLVGCWHWLTHVSDYAKGIREFKFNPENPYTKEGSAHLKREVIFTPLGWLQSGAWQIALTWFWASKRLPNYYTDFWAHPVYSVVGVAAVTYWREIHFYWCHRGMHPWWDKNLGLLDGDVGAWLYRVAHRLHHKSYNPGPWSGLSMHPIEHFLYYSCAWLPPLLGATCHPLMFLYCKYHADIAPIGGHDGHGEPSCNGNFHWLHHAKFECNYGVPWPICFDTMFGTFVDYAEFKKNGNKMPKKLAASVATRRGEGAGKKE